jgi:hypothetical protein
MTNEQLIWNYFKSHGLNDFGTAGLMGNLYAESGLNPKNLQQTYERKLGYSDDSYTDAVDHGIYTNFVKDSAGYGIAQWTFWSRKQALFSFAKSREKSIGDLNMQLDFLMKELREGYIGVLNTLCNATSVLEASNEVLFRFERPANQDESVQAKRCAFGQRYYDLFANRQNEYSFDFAELFAELRKALQNNKCSEYSLAARNWAISNGLIVGNGTLENGEPNYMWQDFTTREQMVTVLHRFVQM